MIIWITGISGVGKTTLALELYKEIKKKNLTQFISMEIILENYSIMILVFRLMIEIKMLKG